MRILIAGCGYVGTALGLELAEQGHSVFGVRRDARGLPPQIAPVSADLGARELGAVLPEAMDALVYCAAPTEPDAYERTYRAGLENVLGALARRGDRLGRAIFTSSTAVYGQDDGGWVDERSPAEPTRATGRVLLAAERTLQSAAGVVLRLAGIYGPGRTWLVRRVHRGEARRGMAGQATRYGNRIHVRDCAGVLGHLLAIESPASIYLGVDDAPAPLDEVYEHVAALLGIDAPPEGDDGEGRGGNKRCSNALLKASGYALRVPTYREGYPEIVRGYLASSADPQRNA